MTRKNVGGLGANSAVTCRSSSTREGVRTARVTAVHRVCLEVAAHNSRAVGCNSKPEELLCKNLEPRVSQSRLLTMAI